MIWYLHYLPKSVNPTQPVANHAAFEPILPIVECKTTQYNTYFGKNLGGRCCNTWNWNANHIMYLPITDSKRLLWLLIWNHSKVILINWFIFFMRKFLFHRWSVSASSVSVRFTDLTHAARWDMIVYEIKINLA